MRAATATELATLADTDRQDFYRVWIEDPDGTMVDVTDMAGENWLDEVTIEVTTEPLISSATIRLFRTIGTLSLAPLIEGSTLNLDAAGSYAPFLNPNRAVTVEVATLPPGYAVADSDYVQVWEGLTRRVEWGGSDETVTVEALDPMTRLARTFIRTVTAYGDDAGAEDMEDVIQEILDDVFGTNDIVLTVATASSFAMLERSLGNVTVLELMQAIIDLNAFNLHWRWDEAEGEFRLTLWQPDRANTTPDHTFGPDDYYSVASISIDDDGIRNDGEVVYTDANGAIQTEVDTRAASIALYEERFIRIDAVGSSIVTSGQGAALLDRVLDDTEDAPLPQQIEMPLFWPVELGDLYAFTANRHYDTTQQAAVFAYRLRLVPGDCATTLTLSGKPSGGYQRWQDAESEPSDVLPVGVFHRNTTARSIAGDEMVTSEDAVATITIPAGYLGRYDTAQLDIVAETVDVFNDGAALRVRLNGEIVIALAVPAASTWSYDIDVQVSNDDALAVQDVRAWASLNDGTANAPIIYSARVALTEDSTADMVVEVTIDWVGGASHIATVSRTLGWRLSGNVQPGTA
jgi:hypothetical protein